MKQKETIRSLWTPTAGMLSGARRAAMLLLTTLLLTMTAQTAWATQQFPLYSGDEGTEAKPYQIKSTDDFDKLVADVNSGTTYEGMYFALTQSLDYNGKTFTPIGTSTNKFKGIFDGKSFAINNVTLNNSSFDNQALFVGIENATIQNLSLGGNSIISGNNNVAGIASYDGCSGCTISNCHVEGGVRITGNGNRVAGIVGFINSNRTITVTNCTNAGVIQASEDAGGIVAYTYGGEIKGCKNTGSVSVSNKKYKFDAGGIVGSNYGATVEGCLNTGAISGYGGIGGIIGYRSKGNVKRCLNTGAVSSSRENYYLGSICGENKDDVDQYSGRFYSIVSDCLYIGDVRGFGEQERTGTDVKGQASKAYTVTASDGITLSLESPTHYEGSGISARSTGGLAYNGKVYAESESEVLLSVTPSDRYYQVDAGSSSQDGGTLWIKMPENANVTISERATAPTSISSADITIPSQPYSNSALTPEVTVKMGDNTLTEGTDYVVSLPDGLKAAGNYEVTVRGINNYMGFKTTTFTIEKGTPTYTTFPTAKVLNYTGSEQVLINAGSVDMGTLQYKLGDGEWTAYSSNIKATDVGSYTIYYKVVGNANVNALPEESLISIIGDITAYWGTNDGSTAETPYIITTTDGMDLLAAQVNSGISFSGKFFRLDADLDYTGKIYDMVGRVTSSNLGPAFDGTFDGNGHTISNVNVSYDYNGYYAYFQGLFSANKGTIKGLKVSSNTISGNWRVGAIAGINFAGATIENCLVGSDVSVSSSFVVGGIASDNYGTIKGCINHATVTYTGNKSADNAGGIVSYLVDASSAIIDCYDLSSCEKAITSIEGSGTPTVTNSGKPHSISAVTGVTIDKGNATATYNVSGLTVYSGCAVYNDNLYAMDGNTVTLTLNYSTPEGYVLSGYHYGTNDVLTKVENTENQYTFVMPDENAEIQEPSLKKLLTADGVSVSAIADQTYTGNAITPTVTVKDGKTDITTECDIVITNNTNVGTANVDITAKSTSVDYSGSTSTTFTIAPKAVTITADNDSKTYDGTPLVKNTFTTSALESGDTHTFTVVMSSGSTITNVGTQPNVIATVDGVDVNTGEETAVGNYLVTTVDGALTISKAPLTVTANDRSIFYGNAADNNGVTYSGFVNNEDENVLGGSLTYTYSNAKGAYGEGNDAPGKYDITPGGLTSDNYAITFVPGKLTVNPFTVPLFAANSSNLWMTWCDKYAYVKPEGVTVYTVSSVATDKVTLAEVSGDVIPAYTPVLLYRAAVGEDAVTATFSALGTAPASGYDAANGICSQSNQAETFTFFGATTVMAKIPDNDFTYYNGGLTYVLYGDKFLKTDSNNGIAANRCWLKLDAEGGTGPVNARQLVIVVDDETTAVESEKVTVNSEKFAAATVWYTLDGRKFSGKPTKKGLYIYNGKKTVVK